jgi:hypothetical protein
MNINEKLSLKKKTITVLNDSQMRAIQGGDSFWCGIGDLSNSPTNCASGDCPGSQAMCGGTNNCSNVAACFATQFRCQ